MQALCAEPVQSVQSVQEVRGPWRVLPLAGFASGPDTVTRSTKRSTKRSTRARSKRPRFSSDVHAAARVGLALDFRACMIFTTGTYGGTKPHCRTTVVGPNRHRVKALPPCLIREVFSSEDQGQRTPSSKISRWQEVQRGRHIGGNFSIQALQSVPRPDYGRRSGLLVPGDGSTSCRLRRRKRQSQRGSSCRRRQA